MTTDTIPRLINLEYLVQGLKLMQYNPKFEDLRLKLIDVSRKKAENEIGIPRSGYSVVRRLKVIDKYTYWSNAKDVLLEFINLGLVKSAPLPSKRVHVALHRNQRYELTELGRTFLDKLKKDKFVFRDKLLELMYKRHSHLRRLMNTLETRDIYIPTYKITGRFDNTQLVSYAAVIKDAVEWLGEKIKQYPIAKIDLTRLEKKLLAKVGDNSGKVKSNLIRVINENIESTMVASYDLPFDNVTFEHLYRLGQQMHIMNYGYLRDADSSTLVVFATAEITDQPNFKIDRHKISNYEKKVIAIIPTEFQHFGEPFVPVYDLRTTVCHKLKINNEVFDYVLRNICQGKYEVDYQIVLLRDVSGVLPPSAEPFRMNNQYFFNIALMKKEVTN